MNRKVLGIDTSNYTTSGALLSSCGVMQQKQLLPVKEGQLGLRQSDAVFHHTQQLPTVLQLLLEQAKEIVAIGVSSRPRDVDGSYMPCFTVGVTAGQLLSAALGVPLYSFSHQAGHIAAALYDCGHLELLQAPFLAYHVSGGTTEAVLVEPHAMHQMQETIVSRSLDLKGGQAIDRVGKLLGLSFPAGKELEKLACTWREPIEVKPTMKGLNFSLSGIENRCMKLLAEQAPPAYIARFCLESIGAALCASLQLLQEKYHNFPVLFAGGVMSNQILRKQIEAKFSAYFASPEFARDNAVGVAVLAAIQQGVLL